MRTVNVIEGIFFAAMEKKTPSDRNAYLDQACVGDSELRRCVERMLDAQPKMGDFLQPTAIPATIEPPPIEERPGSIIGPYKLLQQLGEGGFGVVFMAEQEQPVRRKVALKIIKPGMDSKQVVARFEAERQALALMDHPNIARVLDGGTTESGRPYFVMELVKGVPITEFCDKNRLTPRERLELFIPVCQAVQHAHQKGIIHRDIKPSNVLVTMYDDKPVPKVIDFGVAKAIEQKLTEQTLFTRVGQIIGTLEYMSPEQASPGALDVDTRADVYALGVLLYELLTGTTPLNKDRLQSVAFLEMLRLIREEEPPRPSTRLTESGDALTAYAVDRKTETQKLPKLVKGELDWITMKALEKDRARRYDTANALAADVQRYLKDEQVEACPPSFTYRLQKYARKHKTAFAMTSMAAALLLFGILATSWQAVRARQAEGIAIAERDNAEKARTGEAEQRVIAVAAAAEAKTNEQKAMEAGAEARRLAQKEEAARKEADKERLKAVFEQQQADLARQEEKAARKLADEERFKALFEKQQAELARQKAVDNGTKAEWRLYASHIASAQREWETDNIPLLYHYLNLCRPDFRGWDHDYLYTLANAYQRLLPEPIKDGEVSHMAFSPDGSRLAVSSGGYRGVFGVGLIRPATPGTVQVWDLVTGQKALTLKDTWGHVSFSPDGKRLASEWAGDTQFGKDADGQFFTTTDGRVKVWDAASGKEIFSLKGHTGFIQGLAFSPDRKRLASASWDGTVKLWDLESGKEFRTIKVAEGIVTKGKKPLRLPGSAWSVTFSPDGKQLATADKSTVKLWDAATGQELLTLKEDKDHVENVAFTPDGTRLAVALLPLGFKSEEGQVKLFDLASGRAVFTLKGPMGFFAFSPDGKRLAGTSRNRTVKVWDLADGREVLTLKGPMGLLAFSPDGKRLASTSPEGVKIWELAGSQDCLTLTGDKSDGRRPLPRSLHPAFSPDGKYVAGLSRDDTVKLWEVVSGREIRTFKGHTDRVTWVAFSPDGKQLATSSLDKTVKLWDAASGMEFQTIRGHTNMVARVAFSPDGNYLGSAERTYEGSAPGSVRLWELASGKEVFTAKGTDGALAFSPDGKRLATTFRNVVKVVDVASGKEIMSGEGHTAFVHGVAFSPDGKRLASASADSTVKLWDLPSGQDVLTLKGHLSTVLSVAFSPDGKRLASSSMDTTVKLWDAASGQEVFTLKGHKAAVGGVAFSPDGKRLASASCDFTIKIWDASKSMKEAGQK